MKQTNLTLLSGECLRNLRGIAGRMNQNPKKEMNKLSNRRFCLIFGFLIFHCFVGEVLAKSIRFSATPWSGTATNLVTFLSDFLKPHSLSLTASDAVKGDVMMDSFSEYFNDPAALFDAVSKKYSLSSFYDGDSVYVYLSKEESAVMLDLGSGTVADLKALLKTGSQFSAAEIDGDGVFLSVNGESKAIVQGVPRFLQLVSNIAKALKGSAPPKDNTPEYVFEVVHLEHAFVGDISVEVADKGTAVFPGIHKLLLEVVELDKTTGTTANLAPLTSIPSETGGSQRPLQSESIDVDSDRNIGRTVVINEIDRNSTGAIAPVEDDRKDVFLKFGATEIQELIENPARLFQSYNSIPKGLRESVIRSLDDEACTELCNEISKATGESRKATGLEMAPPHIPSMSRNEVITMLEKVAPKATKLTKVKRQITADTTRNTLLLFDTAENVAFYKRIIAELDEPLQLVEITAAIVDINADSDFNWAANVIGSAHGDINDQPVSGVGGFNAGGSGFGGVLDNVNPALNSALATSSGLDVSTLVIGESFKILSRIKAMETKGDARILSRPSVLTIDNSEAVLDDKVFFYVRVAGQEDSELFKIESGVLIRVRPHIVKEKDGSSRVRMVVHIQDGSPSPTQSLDSIPAISKSTITTQGIVAENQSLLIGGRYRHEESRAEGRVPFLGKIPGLGLPFKRKQIVNRKFQRMFLITPKIIDPHSFHSRAVERVADIVNEGPQYPGLPTAATTQEWNQRNEALVDDAARSFEVLPGQKKWVPFHRIRKFFHTKGNDQ
jgi:type II secretory pathway component GspD/PulD (secretin)